MKIRWLLRSIWRKGMSQEKENRISTSRMEASPSTTWGIPKTQWRRIGSASKSIREIERASCEEVPRTETMIFQQVAPWIGRGSRWWWYETDPEDLKYDVKVGPDSDSRSDSTENIQIASHHVLACHVRWRQIECWARCLGLLYTCHHLNGLT